MHSVRSTVQSRRLGQVADGTRGCTVTRTVLLARQAEDAGRVDDPTLITIWMWILMDHLRRCILASEKGAPGVGVHGCVPGGLGHAPDGLRIVDLDEKSRTIHEAEDCQSQRIKSVDFEEWSTVHVEPAKLLHRSADQVLHILCESYIDGDEHGIATTLSDQDMRVKLSIVLVAVGIVHSTRVVVQIRADHVSTFVGEEQCNGTSDAGTSSGSKYHVRQSSLSRVWYEESSYTL